ncbi:MAG: Sodium:glutamate symporter [Bacteroidetes bacterium]|nr:Sodium:glutamate symporter [Bacteroidota bacterium]
MDPIVFKLDMIQTLALAAVVLFIGYGIRRSIPVLEKYSIPAAVVGGLLFASVALVLRLLGWVVFQFDTSLQAPLMIAFFTTIGLGANLKLLKIGGPQVLLFFTLATILAILQGGLGVVLSRILGVHPYLGLIAGPITLTGGHGTGAAFGKLLEESHQFSGGFTLAMAAATFGVVSGGLIAGPITTALIKRWNPPHLSSSVTPEVRKATAQYMNLEHEVDKEPLGEPPTAFRLLKIIAIMLVAMWIGSLLSAWLNQYFTLPAYIGAMITAAFICNGAQGLKLKIEQRVVDDLGTIGRSVPHRLHERTDHHGFHQFDYVGLQ